MPPEAGSPAALGEAKRWLSQSEHDADDARYCAEGGRHSLACFLAQQSAEKAVQGFLYWKGAEDVWGHSLADLCEDAMAFELQFDAIKSTAALLDKYYNMTRYPSGLPGGIPSEAYDEEDAARAIAIAHQVGRFVRDRIDGLDG